MSVYGLPTYFVAAIWTKLGILLLYKYGIKPPLPAQNQKGDNILYCSLNTQAHQQLHTKRNKFTFSMY